MPTRNVYLPDSQDQKVLELAKELNLGYSKALQKIIEEYLKVKEG